MHFASLIKKKRKKRSRINGLVKTQNGEREELFFCTFQMRNTSLSLFVVFVWKSLRWVLGREPSVFFTIRNAFFRQIYVHTFHAIPFCRSFACSQCSQLNCRERPSACDGGLALASAWRRFVCTVFIQLVTNKWQIGRALDWNNRCPHCLLIFGKETRKTTKLHVVSAHYAVRTVDDVLRTTLQSSSSNEGEAKIISPLFSFFLSPSPSPTLLLLALARSPHYFSFFSSIRFVSHSQSALTHLDKFNNHGKLLRSVCLASLRCAYYPDQERPSDSDVVDDYQAISIQYIHGTVKYGNGGMALVRLAQLESIV